MCSYSTDDHMNSKNIHIYKKYMLKGKKEKPLPMKEKKKKPSESLRFLGSKYNKIITSFQLINTSFRIHKNNN